MGWTIGSYRIEEALEHGQLCVLVANERFPVEHEESLEIGKTKVRVCRVQVNDASHLELWVGTQRIPRSPDSLEQRKAPPGSSCSRHGEERTSYRASAKPVAPARLVCPVCRDAICRGCTSVDRVRCKACLERAVLAEDSATAAANKLRGSAVGVAGLAVGALAIVVAIGNANLGIAAVGAAMLAAGAAKLAFELRRKPREPAAPAPPPPPRSPAEEEKGPGSRELTPRLRGLLLLGVSVVMTYLGVIMPIEDAASKAPSVSISMNAAFLVPTLVSSALAYLLAPAWMTRVNASARDSRSGRLAFYLPMVLLGWVLYEYVKSTVERHGYVFR